MNADKESEKRSLMNAYENLHRRVDQLAEVEGLSNVMIQKFLRTENDPVAKSANVEEKPKPSNPDIIDMFNGLDEKLQSRINIIAANINNMINWIE